MTAGGDVAELVSSFQAARAGSEAEIVSLMNVSKSFGHETVAAARKSEAQLAVDDISFSIFRGETLGLAGETGSGKTTTGRMIAGFERPTSGTITVDGMDIRNLRAGALKTYHRRVHMVFQDPFASLNPRMTAESIIREPMDIHGLGDRRTRNRKVKELFEMVHLPSQSAGRFPHEFSGGQRQRIAIARGLALDPDLIVFDEPVAALDLSVRAQVTNLLVELQTKTSITYLIISHDLLGLRHLSDRIGIMQHGKLVELNDSQLLFENPQAEYTRELIDAIPTTMRADL
jgi:ABC-type glutathione transport system ATPase component